VRADFDRSNSLLTVGTFNASISLAPELALARMRDLQWSAARPDVLTAMARRAEAASGNIGCPRAWISFFCQNGGCNGEFCRRLKAAQTRCRRQFDSIGFQSGYRGGVVFDILLHLSPKMPIHHGGSATCSILKRIIHVVVSSHAGSSWVGSFMVGFVPIERTGSFCVVCAWYAASSSLARRWRIGEVCSTDRQKGAAALPGVSKRVPVCVECGYGSGSTVG